MRIFKKAAVAAMGKLSGVLTQPSAAMGYFTIRMSVQADTAGTIILNGYYQNPSAWVPGACPGPSSVGPTIVNPNGFRDYGSFYIPCTDVTYAAVKAGILTQSFYGNYTTAFTQDVPSGGAFNGIGLGLIRHTWSGPYDRQFTAAWIYI